MAAALLREGVLALRQGVLASVRVPLAQQGLAPAPALARCFSSYLDKQQVQDRVLQVVKTFEKVEEGKVSPSAAFQKDLGLDSLDTVELVMALEEEFAIEIPDSEADKIASCADAISYISSNPMAR